MRSSYQKIFETFIYPIKVTKIAIAHYFRSTINQVNNSLINFKGIPNF